VILKEENKMGFLKRKKKKEEKLRKTFGFQCIPGIPLMVETLRQMLEVPKYVVAEHAMQIGLGYMFGLTQNDELKENLQKHLIYEHHLVDELASEDFEIDAIVDHMGLLPEQEEMARSALRLLGLLKQRDIPPDVASKWIRSQISELSVQVTWDEIRKMVDFGLIEEYHRQFPRLVPGILRILRKYPLEEFEAVLDLADDDED